MEELLLFTDGSVHNQSGIGCGAFLATSSPISEMDQLKQQVQIKKFEQTSSTRLELQTLLWALGEINVNEKKVIVYSDSQLILGLQDRRAKLEKKSYRSDNNNVLKNALLYQEYFQKIDQINIDFIKIKGHKKKEKKSQIDMLFTLVDRAARKSLRKLVIQIDKNEIE